MDTDNNPFPTPAACNGTSPCDEAVLIATCRAWTDWHLPGSSILCVYINIGTRLYAVQRWLGIPDWCGLVQPPHYTLQHVASAYMAYMHAHTVFVCLAILIDTVPPVLVNLAKSVVCAQPDRAAAYSEFLHGKKYLLRQVSGVMCMNLLIYCTLEWMRSRGVPMV